MSRKKKCKGQNDYGFNSYNLLTFSLLGFNIMANLLLSNDINNNANNNNNNQNSAALDQVQTKESSTKAEQNNKNMVMITVPPAGPPVVVPIGRVLRHKNGSFETDQDIFSWRVQSNVTGKTVTVFRNGSLLDDQGFILCKICVVLRPFVAFGNLLFIHTLTNATDDHKYSPLPSADFDSSEVLVSFSAFIFT